MGWQVMMTHTDIRLANIIQRPSPTMITFMTTIEPQSRKASLAMILRTIGGPRTTTLSGESVRSSTHHLLLPVHPTIPSADFRLYTRLLPSH